MLTKSKHVGPPPLVLHNVPYATYTALRDEPSDYGKRMTYVDGVLEIMSPEFRHERASSRIGMLIRAVTAELGIDCAGASKTTFRRAGVGATKGKGKEADECFYIANEARLRDKDNIDLDAGDPPPDLWIEVDNRGSSKGRLPVYAALRVPEVWQYRVRKNELRFLRLDESGAYQAIDHSMALPMLNPARVLEALALCRGQSESRWDRAIREWAREKFSA